MATRVSRWITTVTATAPMADTSRPVDLRRSAYERGLTEGKIAKISNIAPSTYAIVGMDDYARGFRTAYFRRELSTLVSSDTSFDDGAYRVTVLAESTSRWGCEVREEGVLVY